MKDLYIEFATFAEVFEEYIDEEYRRERRAPAPEHLADIIEDDKIKRVYEVTVNFPQKDMLLLQHVECYKSLWDDIIKHYKPVSQLYTIEYCKSGQAHLHGLLEIVYPIQIIKYDDKHLLDDLMKFIYLRLPKNLWRQYMHRVSYDASIARMKTPAVCLNIKNVICKNWIDYMKKNANTVIDNLQINNI